MNEDQKQQVPITNLELQKSHTTSPEKNWDRQAQSALIAIEGIVATEDPYEIKNEALWSVIDTYTERILQFQKKQIIEKLQGMKINEEGTPRHYISLTEVITLIEEV